MVSWWQAGLGHLGQSKEAIWCGGLSSQQAPLSGLSEGSPFSWLDLWPANTFLLLRGTTLVPSSSVERVSGPETPDLQERTSWPSAHQKVVLPPLTWWGAHSSQGSTFMWGPSAWEKVLADTGSTIYFPVPPFCGPLLYPWGPHSFTHSADICEFSVGRACVCHPLFPFSPSGI